MKDELVLERIRRLFELALKESKTHPERSSRHAELIKKLSMRYNVRLPAEIRRRICGKCSAFMVPGGNSRVRTNERQKAVMVRCLRCGHLARYPYRKESKINVSRKRLTAVKQQHTA
jgi:ribonuclease P protein subunit RPR2